MRIIFAASECVPFAKTGGLADVVGALPKALARLGHEVQVLLPLYRQAKTAGVPLEHSGLAFEVPLGADRLSVECFRSQLPGSRVPVQFFRFDPFFDRAALYRTAEGDYPDNERRYIFYCRAVLEWAKRSGAAWDIFHAHDWHAGLIPVYLKTLYRSEPAVRGARSLITIHNLAYQGLFPRETLDLAGLPKSLFTSERLEYWGQVNFLKAALVFSDRLNTVSPTYAREIQGPEMGYGLDGVLRSRRSVLSGILNGIDPEVWDPETDRTLPRHYSAARWDDKAKLKQELLEKQRLFALPQAPLLGIISRLDDQKGFDLLAEISDSLLRMNLQLVLLGTGLKKYHDFFLGLKAKYPRRIGVNLTFDESLAHLIYAGSDMFLMPSKYEPCGLGQMISLRYGTLPVVRETGGLADTVREGGGDGGNGFTFRDYTGEALLACIRRACGAYQDRRLWREKMRTAMSADYSWERSALAYEALYRRMLGSAPDPL